MTKQLQSYIIMLDSAKETESLQELFSEVKKYVALKGEYLQLHWVEKLTLLLSAMLLAAILIVIGMLLLFNIVFICTHLLAPHVGGFNVAYAILTGFFILIGAGIYLMRKWLIVRPITRFLCNLLLKP